MTLLLKITIKMLFELLVVLLVLMLVGLNVKEKFFCGYARYRIFFEPFNVIASIGFSA